MGIYVSMQNEIEDILRLALQEDLGQQGDITSQAVFSANDLGSAVIKSKEAGVLSGVYLLEPLFGLIDSKVSVNVVCKEGTHVHVEKPICFLEGPLQSILSGERIALNFLQRLSGIATKTDSLVQKIQDTSAKLLDTRKTIPGLRILEKRAVLSGGGANHRFGLFDMILLKDTHVTAVGGPDKAVLKAKEFCAQTKVVPIEVEVQNEDEFEKALYVKPNRIMLDNMTVETMQRCVEQRNAFDTTIELEASGNVSEETIEAIARTGVDFISVGGITHSVKALDIHLVLT